MGHLQAHSGLGEGPGALLWAGEAAQRTFSEAAVTGYWAPYDPWLSRLPVWETLVSEVTPISPAGGTREALRGAGVT